MSRIPSSIDELMWLVADQDSPDAIDSFIRRYPEYRREMTRRAMAVKDLRRSKPALSADSIPRFMKRSPRPMFSQRQMAMAMSVGILAIAFTSYALVRGFSPKATPVIPPAVTGTRGVPLPTPAGPVDAGAPKVTGENLSGSANPAVVTPQPALIDPRYSKPITIKLDRAKLVDALTLVCASAGLEPQIAPGMPDIEIVANYTGMQAMDVLQDLAKTYGFSVFDQGNGQVLIIPATDTRVNP